MAILEFVSPGDKETPASVDQFIWQSAGALDEGLHLLVIDLFPPGPSDPNGMHGVLWSRLGGLYDQPQDKPLTLAGYAAEGFVTCYVDARLSARTSSTCRCFSRQNDT